MRTRCSALLLVLSLLTAAWSAEIYVDDDASGDPGPGDIRISDPNEDGSADHPFDSIQEAVDAAWATPAYSSVWPPVGDTIIVAPGHYLSADPWQYDEINFKDKAIRLISSAPTDFSVIQQTVLCGVVIFKGWEGPMCLLQGFKIQNPTCGGILGNNTEAVISHCIISGNGPCGATVVKDVRGRISNCLIVDNTTFHGCTVGPVVSGCPELFNCTIANNISGISIVEDSTTSNKKDISVHNCIIYGNAGKQLTASWWPSYGATAWTFPPIDHCLIQDWYKEWGKMGVLSRTNIEGDPCFVQPGFWDGQPSGRKLPDGTFVGLYPVGTTLIEGDYHLKSEGYRWSKQPIHGVNWDVDFVTSCAIDAGDPMDPLREEPERGPDDPTAMWGVNHAVDIGAYGGTSQASLAPVGERLLSSDGIYYRFPGRPLGVGGVDLRDYLALSKGPGWSRVLETDIIRRVHVGVPVPSNRYEVYKVEDRSQGTRNVLFGFMDDVLYTFRDPPDRVRESDLEDLPKEAKYPRILTVGSTIEAPADLFAEETSPRRSALVLRGTLAEVLAGTKFTPDEFVFARWVHATEFDPNRVVDLGDVIAIREKMADDTASEPIALFARGIGLLLLDGEPVTTIELGPVALKRVTTGSSTSTAQSP